MRKWGDLFWSTVKNKVLEGIYSTVILRDVLERNKATDHALLSRLVMFPADNIGSVTSPNKIGNVLSNEGKIDREKGKQLLKTLGKNYIIDLGFRNMLIGYRDVDFIAEKPDEKLYIQVTETMLGEAARERELLPLRLINDNYEKIVLSYGQDEVISFGASIGSVAIHPYFANFS